MTMAVRRAIRRAGTKDFRLHDARHTFASYQATPGIHARGLSTLLGHWDGRMTARYSHLSDAYLKTAVNGVVLRRSNSPRPGDRSVNQPSLTPFAFSRTVSLFRVKIAFDD